MDSEMERPPPSPLPRRGLDPAGSPLLALVRTAAGPGRWRLQPGERRCWMVSGGGGLDRTLRPLEGAAPSPPDRVSCGTLPPEHAVYIPGLVPLEVT